MHINDNTDGANPEQIHDLAQFLEPMEMCNEDEGNGDSKGATDWVCIYKQFIHACYTIAIVY